MKPTSLENRFPKIDSSLSALWLTSFALLLFITSSPFLMIPLSLGTSLACLSLLSLKITKNIRYILLISFFLLEFFFPELKILKLSFASLFLPFMFYFDCEEEKPYFQFFLTFLFTFFLFISGITPSFLFLFFSLSLLSIRLSSLSFERDSLRETYNNYYYLSRSEKNELETLYKKLSIEQNHQIENAILNERNRLSRDIHDSLGHLTSRGILQIGAMLVTEKDEKKRNDLLSLKTTLSEGMNEVRRSLHGFQNEAIQLKEELQKLIDNFSFCEVNFTFSSTSEFDLKFKYSILFIVKEALTNISRHSSATKASISFIETGEKVYLKISDNGKNAELKTDGMGIYSIKKRAEELRGTAEFQIDNGFRIFITLEKQEIFT